MKQISWLDLFYLSKEFKDLEGSRIETFYYEDKTFYIKTYVKQKGNIFLANKVAECIFLTQQKHTNANQPKGFVAYLRKYLKNGIIQKIEQPTQERILKLEISKKEDEIIKTYFLYMELFAGGNVILTNEENLILSILENKIIKDVKIRAKEEYKLPNEKEKEFILTNLDEEKLKEKIKKSEDSIGRFIALTFGIGGKYANEILFRLNIEKDTKSNTLNETQIQNIINLLIEIKDFKIEPKLYLKNSKADDFTPFKFESKQDEFKEFQTYSQAITEYFGETQEKEDKREKEIQNELKKVNNRLKKQLLQREEIEKGVEKYNGLGNKIYENYSLIEELLTNINKSAKEKGWEHVEQTIQTNPKLKKIIKKLDYRNNKIILNLE